LKPPNPPRYATGQILDVYNDDDDYCIHGNAPERSLCVAELNVSDKNTEVQGVAQQYFL
jgi:hypothetical protein